MSKIILGIEFGSTRIKAVLINEKGVTLASGSYGWENSLIDGYWSYSIDEIIEGLQVSFAELCKDYGQIITQFDAIGISGMMHGYFAFDKEWNLLTPFRSWRNTKTEEASRILSKELKFNIPQRWSCSHYYQAVLSNESHVCNVCHLTTISGYVNYLLTGENVLGVNDASGMFPVIGNDYDNEKMARYNDLLLEKGIKVDAKSLFPKVLLAGENAGTLTKQGALLIDPSGKLKSGAPLCPPEGDMGTGMIATNSIKAKTASVSSGTSANITVVFEKPLTNYYPEIDVISTSNGNNGAIIHTNNCTCEIDYWVNLFGEVLSLFGEKPNKNELYNTLFASAKDSKLENLNLTAFNFSAGETLAHTSKGVPMLIRGSESNSSIAEFMQAQIYSAIATLKLGLDILQKENIEIESVTAHGGYYKSGDLGQKATSALFTAPVSVYKTASEGGAWGIAILAAFMVSDYDSVENYLDDLFSSFEKSTILADKEEAEKFNHYYKNYIKFLKVEKEASKI